MSLRFFAMNDLLQGSNDLGQHHKHHIGHIFAEANISEVRCIAYLKCGRQTGNGC